MIIFSLQVMCAIGAPVFTLTDALASAVTNNKIEDVQHQSDIQHENDIKMHDELGYHYYVPEQTTFDMLDETYASVWSSTSPPHLSIQPSPVTKSADTTSCKGQDSFSHDTVLHLESTDMQMCVTENLIEDFLTSPHTLKPSISSEKEVSVITGHMEVQAKTDSLNDVLEHVHFLSHPSTKLVFEK